MRGRRAVLEQQLGNRPVADVRRRAERGFPIAVAPVPRCLCQLGMLLQQLADARQIDVRDAHHLLRERGMVP